MSMKVLILDPDLHFAAQASAYLESHAHLVVRHVQPMTALAQARHWAPDLAIVAAEAAGNGFMESLYGMTPRPAVLLTEHMDQFARAWRLWQTGGDELLMKPVFRASELHAAIVTALENAASGTRATPTRAVGVSA